VSECSAAGTDHLMLLLTVFAHSWLGGISDHSCQPVYCFLGINLIDHGIWIRLINDS